MHQPVELPDEPSIKFVRLSTGEDLITEVVEVKEDKDEYYLLVNPLKIVYLTNEKNGSIMLSFIEWVFPKICSKQQFKVYPNDVITLAEVTERMEEYYYETIIKLENFVNNTEDDGVELGDPKELERKAKNKEVSDLLDDEIEHLKTLLEDLNNTSSKRKLN